MNTFAQRVGCDSSDTANDFSFDQLGNSPSDYKLQGSSVANASTASAQVHVTSEYETASVTSLFLLDANDCYGGVDSQVRYDVTWNESFILERPGAAEDQTTVIPFQAWTRTVRPVEQRSPMSGSRSFRVFGSVSGSLDTNFNLNSRVFETIPVDNTPVNGEIRFTGPGGGVLVRLEMGFEVETIGGHDAFVGSDEFYFLLEPLPDGVTCRSGSGAFAGCDGPPVNPPADPPLPPGQMEPPIGSGNPVFFPTHTLEGPVEGPICGACSVELSALLRESDPGAVRQVCAPALNDVGIAPDNTLEGSTVMFLRERSAAYRKGADNMANPLGVIINLLPSDVAGRNVRDIVKGFFFDRVVDQIDPEGTGVVSAIDDAHSVLKDPATGPAEAIRLGARTAGKGAEKAWKSASCPKLTELSPEVLASLSEQTDTTFDSGHKQGSPAATEGFDFGFEEIYGSDFAGVDEAFWHFGLGIANHALAESALQEYLAAVVVGDEAEQQAQAQLASTLWSLGDAELDRAAEGFERMGPILEQIGARSDPGDPAAALAAAQESVRTSGLPSDLVEKARAAGLGDEDFEAIRQAILDAEAPSQGVSMTALPGLLRDLAISLKLSSTYADVVRERAGEPELPPLSAVNAGSFGFTVAPGSIVSIFGSRLAGQLVASGSPTLPATIDGVEVTVDGSPIPLFFVSPGQINAQIPYSALGPSVDVAITRDGSQTQERSLALADQAPSIFTVAQTGSGQGIVVFANTATFVAPEGALGASRPARPGDALTIYASGLGAVVPPIAAGLNSCGGELCRPDASNLTIRRAAVTPAVRVGETLIAPADVLFAGLAPQFVGLYQISFIVPDGIETGDAVPIRIEQEPNVSAANVTIALESP